MFVASRRVLSLRTPLLLGALRGPAQLAAAPTMRPFVRVPIAAFSMAESFHEESVERFDLSAITQDDILFDIQTKCKTIDTLSEYAFQNQEELSLSHWSVILSKLFRMVQEVSPQSDYRVRVKGQNLFNESVAILVKNITVLDCTSLQSLMNILSKGTDGLALEPYRPSANSLKVVEEVVIDRLNEFLANDMTVIVTALIKLNYTPLELLRTLNLMVKMSPFGRDQSIRMIEGLTDALAKEQSPLIRELHSKFYDQLALHKSTMNSFGVCKTLACLDSELKLDLQRDEVIMVKNRAQLMVDTLTDMLRRGNPVASLDIFWGNKFMQSIERSLYDSQLADSLTYTPLETRMLQLQSVATLEESIDSVEPKVLVNCLQVFDNDRQRTQLVEAAIQSLKEERLDIRRFPLGSLARFVSFVADYSPQNVQVFFNYVLMAFDSGYFRMTQANFLPMTQMFSMFVLKGFLTPESQNKFQYAYILGLKEVLFPPPGQQSEVNPMDLIKVTWSLIALQSPGRLSNPLIPKLLEQLYSFDRPEVALSKNELVMLHQIQIYVEGLIKKEKLPEQYADIIPGYVRELADEVYQQWDTPLYADVQRDVAKKLLKLRTDFSENCRPLAEHDQLDGKELLNRYKVPFRLDTQAGRQRAVIVLKGDLNSNKDTGEWHGVHGIIMRTLENPPTVRSKGGPLKSSQQTSGIQVKEINVNDWRSLDEVGKLELLDYTLKKGPERNRKKKNMKLRGVGSV